MLFLKDLNFQMIKVKRDPMGRFLFAKGKLDSNILTFTAIYAPNKSQIAFLKQTFMSLRIFAQGPVFVAGDFNYVVNLAMDRTYYRANRDKNNFRCSLLTPLLSLLEEF